MAITVEELGRRVFGFAVRLTLSGDVEEHLSAIRLAVEDRNDHGAHFSVTYQRPVGAGLSPGPVGDDRCLARILDDGGAFGCHVFLEGGRVRHFEIYALSDHPLPDMVHDLELVLLAPPAEPRDPPATR